MNFRRPALAFVFACGLAANLPATPVELLSRAEPTLAADSGGAASEVPPHSRRSVSDDGRFVVFVSAAVNLVPGQVDGNDGNDVFLFDRVDGSVRLVSHAPGLPLAAGNLASSDPVISGDGAWVAFSSFASDLSADSDANGPLAEDVYLFSRASGAVTLVSVASGASATGNGRSIDPVLDDLGGYLAFTSYATDLVPGFSGSPNAANVYLHSRASATTTLVSHVPAAAATAGAGFSENPVISGDGGHVAYESSAHDVVAGLTGTGFGEDVYRWSRLADTTVLVSHTAASTTEYSARAGSPTISDDGAWIAFSSSAATHVTGGTDTNNVPDVFLWDAASGALTLVSHAAASATTAADLGGDAAIVSDDGARVVFRSMAHDLVTGQVDAGVDLDIFVWTRATGAMALASRSSSSAGTGADGRSDYPSISGDGAWIAFESTATDLVAGDANGASDAFLFSTASGTVTLASAEPGGSAGTDESWRAEIAASGSHVAYTSLATDLAAGVVDTNGASDVFLFDRAAGTSELASARGGLASATAGGPSEPSAFPPTSVSADGRRIAFVSRATNLVPGQVDTNGANDVFVRDRDTGTTVLVSHAAGAPATTAAGASFAPVLSADGEWVAFVSNAADVSGTDGNGLPDVFLHHLETGAVQLVSRSGASATTTGNKSSGAPAIFAAGASARVAFESSSTDLVTGATDANNTLDVFLFDATTGVTTLVSHAAGSPLTAAAGESRTARLSADGAWLGFLSAAIDVVAGQSEGNLGTDLFLREVATGDTRLLSRQAGSPTTTGNGVVQLYSLNADASWIAFAGEGRNHVAGQLDSLGSADVFLVERASGSTTLVSHVAGQPLQSPGAAGSSNDPWISADGRRVAFTSLAGSLVTGQVDGNGVTDVFLHDRDSGETVLVSHAAGAPTTAGGFAGGSFARGIGPAGDQVVYYSHFVDLIAGTNPALVRTAVYLYDRPTHSNRIVSRSRFSPLLTGNGASEFPVMSADASTVAFRSLGSDLVAADANGAMDAFAFDNGAPGRYFTVMPCRRLDTRIGGSAFTAGERRLVLLHGFCGIPETAKAVALNVTAVSPTTQGNLAVDAGTPGDTSTLNFPAGVTRASLHVAPLDPAGTGALGIQANLAAGGLVDVVVDVVGYFE
jgi:Tol biopolymer transport system component